MLPAQPPLPTSWNLPFQFRSGSQISPSMLESALGFNVVAARQSAGSWTDGVVPFVAPAGCTVAVPLVRSHAAAACRVANVMLTFGNVNEAIRSQLPDCCANSNDGQPTTTTAANSM